MAALALLALVRYRGALGTFFFLDDFWMLRDAAAARADHSALALVFRPGPAGFGLYRPFTTVGYSYVLQTLFGLDPTAHHAFHLLVFAAVVALGFAVAYRLTGSVVASSAAALIQSTAPGQAVDAYWVAAFEVTGAAVVLLLMMWCWLATTGRRRVLSCTALQAVGLLASEHATAGPALLLVLAAMRREPVRRTAELVPSAVLVAAYLAAKLYYFVYLSPPASRILLAVYGLTMDVRVWVQHLGQYLVACFVPLTLWNPGESVCSALGAALIAVFGLAAWRAYRSGGPWTLIAGGIALFVATLGPVLFQRSRVGSSYVCVAALGAALAVVGGCELTGRHGRSLACAIAIAMLLLDEVTGERAWRQTELFRLVTGGSREGAYWMTAVEHAVGDAEVETEILVPSNRVTDILFRLGRVQSFYPAFPRRVTLYDPRRPPVPKAGQIVVDRPVAVPSTDAYPGADRRWGFLRRLAGSPRPGE